MATSAPTSSSTLIAVPSPSGDLLATTTVGDNGRRVVVRNVRRDLRVQCTLLQQQNQSGNRLHASTTTGGNSSSNNSNEALALNNVLSTKRRLVWLSDTLVATLGVISDTAVVTVTVFDVTRGVVAYTLDYATSTLLFDANAADQAAVVLQEDSDNKALKYSFVDWSVVESSSASSASTDVAATTLVVAVQTRKKKCLLLVYNAYTGKLERKVKAGKMSDDVVSLSSSGCVGSTLAVGHDDDDDDMAVAAWHFGSSLRVTSLQTGDKVSKLSSAQLGLAGMTTNVTTNAPILAAGGSLACTVHASNRSLLLFVLSTGRILKGPPIATKDASAAAALESVQLLKSSVSDDSYWLLLQYERGPNAKHTLLQLTVDASDKDGTVDSYEILQSRPLQIKDSLDAAKKKSDVALQYYLTSNQLVVVRQSETSSSTTSIHSGGLELVSMDLNNLPESTDKKTDPVLYMTFASASSDGSKDAESQKRKSSESSSRQAVVLGPGQAGGEARNVTEASTKRPKLLNDDDVEADENEDDGKDDDDGPTIAERLAQLQKVMDEENDGDDDDEQLGEEDAAATTTTKATRGFVPRHATTESLTHVLTQALQSSDHVMLEQALAVRDVNVLRETCIGLPSKHAVSLLQALTMRLATKPARAEQLVPWITAVLQSNHVQSVEELQPLQNLLQERLEVFPLLLQLEGRLEHMTAM